MFLMTLGALYLGLGSILGLSLSPPPGGRPGTRTSLQGRQGGPTANAPTGAPPA